MLVKSTRIVDASSPHVDVLPAFGELVLDCDNKSETGGGSPPCDSSSDGARERGDNGSESMAPI